MDRTLLEIFATEQTEHIERIRKALDVLKSVPAGAATSVFDELLRRAHTLKGASRAVGLELTEQLVHRLESVFVGWRAQNHSPSDDERLMVFRALDGIEDILAWALGTRSEPDAASLLSILDHQPVSDTQPAAIANPGSQSESEQQVPSAGSPSGEMITVSAGLLDEVIRSISQLVHVSHAGEGRVDSVSVHVDRVEQMVEDYARLRRNCGGYIRHHAGTEEFRPVQECFDYLDSRLWSLLLDARNARTAQNQYKRGLRVRVEEAHDAAWRARMTPAHTAFRVFGAMIRDLAAQEGKRVDYRVEGLDLQADREVLQALKDPVMHILRNSVSHGIELPEERLAAGKEEEGVISLQLRVRGERLLLSIQDDGRGLNLAALADRAVRQRLMSESSARIAPPDVLARLIFQPGMSTSSVVTSLSGRGMGLSAVEQRVSALHGDIRVRTWEGKGVRISISVPLTTSTQNVLLVREGVHVFALPVAFVERLLRFRPAEVRIIDGEESLAIDDRPVRITRLADLLGIPVAENEGETTNAASNPIFNAAVLTSGEEVIAVVVEEFLEEREALVKETRLGPAAAGWSAGAIALEDGSVAIMLNVGRLMQGDIASPDGRAKASFQAPQFEQKRNRILVVDDSVTTRAMERSLLEAHGYEVKVAVDGLEAWNAVRTDPPDLVISDVSMPRMDGFQLLSQMKQDRDTAKIPVILVTSLESREEQERGLSLGADAYIVKRKFDQRELLRIVRQIV